MMCTPIRRTEASEPINHYDRILNQTIDDVDCFQLSTQAAKSLDILTESKLALSSRSSSSVYGVLNKCRTTNGQKLLMCWLKRPLINKSKIEQRLSIVKFFCQRIEIRQEFHDSHLRKLPDLLKISKALSSHKTSNISLMDLLKAYRAFKTAKLMAQQLEKTLNSCEDDGTNENGIGDLCEKLSEKCEELSNFGELIERTIYTDKQDSNGNIMIRPDFSEDFANIIRDIEKCESRAHRALADVADDLNLDADKTIKLESDSIKGFAYKVTRKHEAALRGKPQYSQLSNAKKDGFRFSNKELLKISSTYVDLRHEYATLAREVEEKAIDVASSFDEPLQELGVLLAIIDVFVSFSVVALCNDYCCPMILESECDKIEVIKMRHPCLELQPDVGNYVTNDVKFDGQKKKFYLITGPNMGGKSTFIKSVAINVLMAQCGSFVPAEWASISIVDGIYTRVGAGDRQLEGLSTFMEEMMDISDIISRVTSKSLVIIDELGRGTSTYDGFGLAWSVSRYLAVELKCYTLFATHFYELTDLESEVRQVGNLHVTAHCSDDDIQMLYEIKNGACAQSFGIQVARLTQFPERIIKCAEQKLRQYEEIPGCDTKEDAREYVKKIVGCVKKELSR